MLHKFNSLRGTLLFYSQVMSIGRFIRAEEVHVRVEDLFIRSKLRSSRCLLHGMHGAGLCNLNVTDLPQSNDHKSCSMRLLLLNKASGSPT